MDQPTRLLRFTREILLPLAILLAFSTIVGLVKMAWPIAKHALTEHPAKHSDKR